MNIIEAMRIIHGQVSHQNNADLWMALDEVEDMIAAYDALAPDWSKAPDGAQWYTIDAENQCYWHIDEPVLFDWAWDSSGLDWRGFTDIPLGIDWRLCKWQRPEAA